MDNSLSAVNEVVSLQLDHLPSGPPDLSADHERKGSHIAQSVRLIITKNPRLREKYQHPGAEHDRLYESIYTHREGDDRCVIDCDSISPSLVRRSRRELNPNESIVHYDLIAFAD